LCLPLIIGIGFTVVYCFVYKSVCRSETRVDIASTNITFGTTFAAFSVTALSLIALLQSKEHFDIVQKVGIYEKIILNYRNSIVLSFIVLAFGLIGQLLIFDIGEKHWFYYCLLSVFAIVFTSVYLIVNVVALVELLLMK